jgi:hypothetical protein
MTSEYSPQGSLLKRVLLRQKTRRDTAGAAAFASFEGEEQTMEAFEVWTRLNL